MFCFQFADGKLGVEAEVFPWAPEVTAWPGHDNQCFGVCKAMNVLSLYGTNFPKFQVSEKDQAVALQCCLFFLGLNHPYSVHDKRVQAPTSGIDPGNDSILEHLISVYKGLQAESSLKTASLTTSLRETT